MTAPEIEPPRPQPEVSVALVGICGPTHLARCLDALRAQRAAPAFDIVVAYDPELDGVAELASRYPEARLVCNRGQRTPLELASRAIEESRGEIVLLSEDHCIPAEDWVAELSAAVREHGAATGGSVDVVAGATATDWAFYFVDFFRYAPPLREGESPTLTVCNVGYRRSALEAIAETWRSKFFHETAVNDRLRQRFGPLWLTPRARVTMDRRVTLRAALYERYAFGRLFGCTRLEFATLPMRALYTLLAPLLPLLLMARMAARALPAARLRAPLLRALPVLGGLVVSWSLGEWLGYLTRRRPARLTVAPERGPARPRARASRADRSRVGAPETHP